jgi:hypothetical protein
VKDDALSYLAFRPDFYFVMADNTLHYSQINIGPGKLRRLMQTLE